jgi:L-threonylcarbamoyladenylate synthase
VIVHVANADAARALSSDWPLIADAFAEKFWPGPLTLVVPRASHVPDIVTAGGATVGVRVPHHWGALALLEAAFLPVAAPSANRSEHISPTRAAHVAISLENFVDDLLILDGGPCTVGLESTVLDVGQTPPCVLRPGQITLEMLRTVDPSVVYRAGVIAPEGGRSAPSPGLSPRHYAPKAKVLLVTTAQMHTFPFSRNQGLLWYSQWPGRAIEEALQTDRIPHFQMPPTPEAYAAHLYDRLYHLDAHELDFIVVELPPQTAQWDAVNDRLRRSAG